MQQSELPLKYTEQFPNSTQTEKKLLKSSSDTKRKTLENQGFPSWSIWDSNPRPQQCECTSAFYVIFCPSENARFCWISEGICLYCYLFFFFICAYSSQKVPTIQTDYLIRQRTVQWYQAPPLPLCQPQQSHGYRYPM